MPDTPAPGPRPFFSGPRQLKPRLLLLALAAGALFTDIREPALPLDDAYIHLTFARNLAQGFGFGFNPGEPSLGFSSPLWIFLLALMRLLGLNLVLAAKALGVIAFTAAVALLVDLTRLSILALRERRGEAVASPGSGDGAAAGWEKTWREKGPSLFALLAGLGLALSGNELWLAGSGMEAMLFLALGLAALRWLRPESPRPILGGLALGLLLLTRAEGLLLLVIIMVPGLIASPRRGRILSALALALVAAAPWFLYTLAQTGHLLPPTRAGKLASDLFNSGFAAKGIRVFAFRHLVYFWNYDRGPFLLLLIGAAAAIVRPLTSRRDPDAIAAGAPRPPGLAGFVRALTPVHLLVLWALGQFALHALFFRSTAAVTPYHNLRYQVMLIPAIIAGAAYSLAALVEGAGRTIRRGPAAKIALAFLIVPLVLELVALRSWRRFYAENVSQLRMEHRAAADWARRELPPTARIAGLDIGIMGFYADRYIIDLGGLVDPEIIPFLKKHATGPYLVRERATHYFAMVRHDSERITGVKKDEGKLYSLRLLRRFDYPLPRDPAALPPVDIHSLGIEVYELAPLASGRAALP